LTCLCCFSSSYSQEWGWPNDFNYPEDSALRQEADRNYHLYKVYLENKEYSKAQKPHTWLLHCTPSFSESLYEDGVLIYHELQELESESSRKNTLQDSVLTIVEQRARYFETEMATTFQKALFTYMYLNSRNDSTSLIKTYKTLQHCIQSSGYDTPVNLLVAFHDTIKRVRVQALISEDELMKWQIILDDLISNKFDSGQLSKKEQIQLSSIDKVFINPFPPLSCKEIEQQIGSQLTHDDFDKALFYLQLARAKGCEENASYIKSIKIVHQHQPDYILAKYIALKSLEKRDFDEADKYFKTALKLATNHEDKADLFLNMAKLAEVRGQKPAARDHAYQALKLDSSKTEAYSIIGRLYMNSSQDCAQKQDSVKDKAIFYAAYDMFKKAGDQIGMKSAEAQFPLMSEILTHNYKIGDQIPIGCWINETVTIMKNSY